MRLTERHLRRIIREACRVSLRESYPEAGQGLEEEGFEDAVEGGERASDDPAYSRGYERGLKEPGQTEPSWRLPGDYDDAWIPPSGSDWSQSDWEYYSQDMDPDYDPYDDDSSI